MPVNVYDNQPALTRPLQECEGHCYADSDCDSGLICYKGDPFVPGCDSQTITYSYEPYLTNPSYCVRPINVMKGIQGSESRIVRYQGTSCYFSKQGEITSLEQHMLCSGGFCATDVEVLVKTNPTLRKTVHDGILSSRLLKGAEGSTPQIIHNKAMCSITLESAPINLNSRAIFHNSALQYLDSDQNEGIGVVRASSRANTELGRAGAVGPGMWTAAYAKQLELFDMEATGTSEFVDTLAQGFFPVTITTTKSAIDGSLIIKGTEGLDTGHKTVRYDRYKVPDPCTLRLYADRRFEHDSNSYEGFMLLKGDTPKCISGCNLARSGEILKEDLIEKISSFKLEGKNCRAMFQRAGKDPTDWIWDNTQGMSDSYPYRVVQTSESVQEIKCQEIDSDHDDGNCRKDSMGRDWDDWEDDITHVWLTHMDEDRCTPFGGHWTQWRTAGQRMTCNGQMRYGSAYEAGARIYSTIKMDNTPCSTSSLDARARQVGIHKMFDTNPRLADVGCECCSIDIENYSGHGSLVPEYCTSRGLTCTHNVQLAGGGTFTIAYLGGSGVGTLGYRSWKGTISGPDGTVIADTGNKEMTYKHRANYARRRRVTPSPNHGNFITEMTTSAATKKGLVLSDVLIKWKCSNGKFFVCEHALSPPPTGASCCQQCPLGQYRTNNRCVACVRGKFNPIGHSTVAQDYTIHYGTTVANLQVSLGDPVGAGSRVIFDKRIVVPSCQPGSCNCHSFKKNTKCADGTRVPARSVTSALRTSFTDGSKLHLDVRTRDCSAVCDRTPMCSVYESRVVVVDGRVTAQCFTFDETCVEVAEDPYWANNPEFATVVNRKVLLKAISFKDWYGVETQLLPIQQYYEVGKKCDSPVLYERNFNDWPTLDGIIDCESMCLGIGFINQAIRWNTEKCYVASYNNGTKICKLFGLECFRTPLVPTTMDTLTFTARKSYVVSDNNVEYPQFKFTRPYHSILQNYERLEYSFQCTLSESVRHACLDCPAGQYADEPAMPACKHCTSDTFQPLEGQTTCNACDPGSFSYREADRFGNPIEQLNFCKRPVAPCNPVTSKLVDNVCVDKRICPEGHVFSAATSQCVACEQGFFAGSDNVCASISDVCHCEPDVCQDTAEKRGFVFRGKYNSDTLRCEPDCEALGAFFDYSLQSCQCEGGLALSASQLSCSACPRGTYTVESRCVACAAGKYQPKSGEPECLLCDNGQYADVSGSVRCKFCDTIQQSTAQREGCMLCGPDQTTSRANRLHRDKLPDVPCTKECPHGTYAVHDSASNSPLCADLCNKGETLDSIGRCTACETGKYKAQRPPVERDISHNTSYACQYCPAGKFQTLEGRDDCTDGIPFTDVTGVDEPTTVDGLRKVVHYCAATIEEAQCKLCGIDRTDQSLTISSGVWVADEGQPLWSQQNYFRIGNLNDGYSKWKYLGNSSLGTKPLCTYETFAGYDVPPITSPPHCQMLPNTDYLDDTQTCGDIGQNMAASVNTFSRQQCRRCSWPFKPDSACGCVADEEPYYFPGFKHDTDTRVISGFGPFLHGGAANECPDYSNLPSDAFGLVDGVSLVDLKAVNMPLTQCPDRAQATTCNMGAILCEPECTCNCHPGFAGEQCDTCEDTNADFDLLCEACKPGWVTGLFNRCSRCESGLDVRTACTECIPFLDDTMCYGVNEACVPHVQRPEVSFMRTRHTWISDSSAFASMPHASAGHVPDYLDNKCIAHDGLVYSFHQESSTVLVQPGNGTADVPRQAVATWPWTLNVQHSLNFTVCDDVDTTAYLVEQNYTTTHAPDELLWQCVEDEQNRQWVVAGVDKMQTTGCSAPWTHANDVLRVMPTGPAFTPLTARLHDFVSADLRWTSTNASSYYECSTADRAWLYMLETGVCMHKHDNGTQLPINAVAVTGNRDTGAVGYPWRSPVSIMDNDTDLMSTHADTVSRLHCVQLCDGAEYWVYKRASCRCFGAGFMQHDEETPLGYVMLYDANPENATFTQATGNKPYRCPRNATHAPWGSVCTKGAEVFAEWGGVRESTPLLRQYYVTEIVTGYEDTTIDIAARPESTCSTQPFQTTQVENTRIVHPMGHQTADNVPVTESRDTQMLFRETAARTQGLYEIHIEPDFDECNELAEASSVLANLQAQQTAGSTFCTEGTCDHIIVDMTQSIARAQNAYQLALAKCELSIDLMGDTHFYVSLTQCAPNEVPSAQGCLNASDVATPVTTAPTPAPSLAPTSSLVKQVTSQTLYFGNCTCNAGGLCNCTCNCDGQYSSIAETQLPFNHTSGAVDCNEFCRLAPLPDVSTDFCTYSRERRLFHMHYMPEWTLTRSTNTTDDADAMQWCQSNIACSLFTRDGTSYKYYADPEYTLVNCNQPRLNSLFTQAADYSLTATTYYKSTCCTGVII